MKCYDANSLFISSKPRHYIIQRMIHHRAAGDRLRVKEQPDNKCKVRRGLERHCSYRSVRLPDHHTVLSLWPGRASQREVGASAQQLGDRSHGRRRTRSDCHLLPSHHELRLLLWGDLLRPNMHHFYQSRHGRGRLFLVRDKLHQLLDRPQQLGYLMGGGWIRQDPNDR